MEDEEAEFLIRMNKRKKRDSMRNIKRNGMGVIG